MTSSWKRNCKKLCQAKCANSKPALFEPAATTHQVRWSFRCVFQGSESPSALRHWSCYDSHPRCRLCLDRRHIRDCCWNDSRYFRSPSLLNLNVFTNSWVLVFCAIDRSITNWCFRRLIRCQSTNIPPFSGSFFRSGFSSESYVELLLVPST